MPPSKREQRAAHQAAVLVEQNVEQYVRDKMRPKLVANARDATARFFKRDGIATSARRK